MIGIASNEFGCATGDVTCYCTNQDFGYGIRDCSTEACGSDVASQVIAFGTAYCQSKLQLVLAHKPRLTQRTGALASAGSASASAASTGALSVLTSALASASASASAGDASGAQSTPVSTSALVGTVTSDGSTYETTTGFSTIYGPVGGAASSAASQITDSAGSVIASAT